MINGFSDSRFSRSGFVSVIWGTPTARLITVNCAVFLLVTITNLICGTLGIGHAVATRWTALPGDIQVFVTRPWTLFTYMVVNSDILRLIFNMLWLLCFGRLLSLPLDGRRLIWLYIAGGVAGGTLYLLGTICHFWQGGWLMGPSASIIAITVATALMLPRLEINMLIIGPVKVIWVAMCVLLMYFLDIDGHNMGGNAAHVGGAVAGIIFGLAHGRVPRLRLRFMEALGKKRKSRITTGTPIKNRPDKEFSAEDNRRLDTILDKVKRAGYGALSADEKRELFDISRRIK